MESLLSQSEHYLNWRLSPKSGPLSKQKTDEQATHEQRTDEQATDEQRTDEQETDEQRTD